MIYIYIYICKLSVIKLYGYISNILNFTSAIVIKTN